MLVLLGKILAISFLILIGIGATSLVFGAIREEFVGNKKPKDSPKRKEGNSQSISIKIKKSESSDNDIINQCRLVKKKELS